MNIIKTNLDSCNYLLWAANTTAPWRDTYGPVRRSYFLRDKNIPNVSSDVWIWDNFASSIKNMQ
jgi:hypothetical protein